MGDLNPHMKPDLMDITPSPSPLERVIHKFRKHLKINSKKKSKQAQTSTLISPQIIDVPMPTATPTAEPDICRLQVTGTANYVFLLNNITKKSCVAFDEVYDIKIKLGEGSFGEVFKGYNKITGNIVALKFAKNTKNAASMFLLEKNNLEQIANICDSFVCIEGWGMYNGRSFIAMEYLKGVDFKTYIQQLKGKRIPAREIVNIGKQLIDSVEKLHDKGLAHTDIKPENIMYHEGDARIVDLGLACNESNCHVGGTGFFMPLDVDKTLSNRQASDWFSLTLSLLYIATLGNGKPLDREEFILMPHDYLETLSLPNSVKEIILKVLDIYSQLDACDISLYYDDLLSAILEKHYYLDKSAGHYLNRIVMKILKQFQKAITLPIFSQIYEASFPIKTKQENDGREPLYNFLNLRQEQTTNLWIETGEPGLFFPITKQTRKCFYYNDLDTMIHIGTIIDTMLEDIILNVVTRAGDVAIISGGHIDRVMKKYYLKEAPFLFPLL